MMEFVKELSIAENPLDFSHYYFLTNIIGYMEKKWNILRDCIIEKWIHFFGLCMLKGKIVGKPELLCGWENYESFIANVSVF